MIVFLICPQLWPSKRGDIRFQLQRSEEQKVENLVRFPSDNDNIRDKAKSRPHEDLKE